MIFLLNLILASAMLLTCPSAFAKSKDKGSGGKPDDSGRWFIGAEVFNGFSLSGGVQYQGRLAIESSIEKTEPLTLFAPCSEGDDYVHRDLAAVFAGRIFFGGSFNLKAGAYARSLSDHCRSEEKGEMRSVGLQVSIGNRWVFERFYIGGDWIGAGIGTEVQTTESNRSTGRFLFPRFTLGVLL